MCYSFQSASDELCFALFSITKNSFVDPSSLYSFLASTCRLVDLVKQPGVHPIGVGKVIRRIVDKCVSQVIQQDGLKVSGINQLCDGQPGGREAAVHAIRQLRRVRPFCWLTQEMLSTP